ncbi:AaceriAEL330Cp [[Ashbya] aceris (nom. inval.)]|nr:AaceriAEL330Cp [[Ashbya] aceris (nom. inval.)]
MSAWASQDAGKEEDAVGEFARMLERRDAGLLARVLSRAQTGPEAYVRGLWRAEVGLGRWRLARVLGCGSVACVFELGDGALALKVPTSRRKAPVLLHEVLIYSHLAQQAGGRLAERHVVPFHGVAAVTRRQYRRLRGGEVVPALVLDRMEATLEAVHRRAAVSKGQWWRYARDLVAALQFLRESCVVHGDIKTANVLVRGQDAFLADFTSAAVCDAAPEPLTTTLEYCAPGLIGGGQPTHSTDVYAAGLCLLALITRFEPFRELSMMKSHSSAPTHSLHETQWLMNAISKGDPIKYNVLSQDLYDRWADELHFLRRFFAPAAQDALSRWLAESNARVAEHVF